MANSLEDLKPQIDDALQYLNSCNNFAEDEAIDALNVLNKSALYCTDPLDLGAYMLNNKFGQLCVKMWKDLSKYLTQNIDSQGLRNARAMMVTFINMTDESPDLCVEMGKNGCIHLLVESLESIEKYLQQQEDVSDLLFLDRMLGMLHNCIRISSQNRSIFRQTNAVQVLKSCLKINNRLVQIDCLMILAYIVDEKEREILATSEKGLRLLLHLLKQGVDADGHRVHCGDSDFSVYELIDAINLLAINDVNKVEIEKNDVIPYIIRMLRDDFDDNEKRIAAEALWNLSFIESIRKSEIVQNTISVLEQLLLSQDKDLRGACASAIWQLKGGSSTNTPGTQSHICPPTYEEAITSPANNRSPSAQVMISYQWDSQERAIQIRNRLVADGYRVWMDITNMKGDILEAMADAVQRSDVLLLCMTEKYKDSRSCRSEATYAYKLQKKVIPLLLERGYKPDGWLGLMQGMDLYYEFHSHSQLDDSLPKLLKAVRETTLCGGGGDESNNKHDPIIAEHTEVDHASPPPQQTQQKAAATSMTSSISSPTNISRPRIIKEWSTENVRDWLQEVGLVNLGQTFDFCDGRHLQKLHTQLQQNYQNEEKLRTDFNLDARSCLQFTVELEDLFEKGASGNLKHSRKHCCVIN
ncbi:uncharacterized protein [Amphiura filiformis]|uniref:uncharacterized protein n=1 Tax=Amphiura filiformis TaxID=82378 RepID=UPI003B21922B